MLMLTMTIIVFDKKKKVFFQTAFGLFELRNECAELDLLQFP